jgi:shikimate kinase
MSRPIVITGFMGCGKTRVARELARGLNMPVVDLDDSITSREGRSPAQLIREEGEPYFRAIETNALDSLLETGGAGVIALGGGAWIEAANRELIKEYGCQSVWLDVPFELCWSRIEASAEDRPLGKTREQAQALFGLRQPIYQLANIRIEVGAEDNEITVTTRIRTALITRFQDLQD